MTGAGAVYGQALYDLAKSEDLDARILEELSVLEESFSQEPQFLRLLAAENLSRQERCAILDTCFQHQLHPYVLSFLKILTEKGYPRHFADCCIAYRSQYHEDHGILPVTAITAVPLTEDQSARLADKLKRITEKQILLQNRVDPAVLGGIRLDYSGIRLDDTVANRLDAIRKTLKNTVL